jgi:GrpB-like predicted nucleotidyltransferase (UPF0157 family)
VGRIGVFLGSLALQSAQDQRKALPAIEEAGYPSARGGSTLRGRFGRHLPGNGQYHPVIGPNDLDLLERLLKPYQDVLTSEPRKSALGPPRRSNEVPSRALTDLKAHVEHKEPPTRSQLVVRLIRFRTRVMPPASPSACATPGVRSRADALYLPRCHHPTVDAWAEAGLGLDYGEVRLSRASEAWLRAGADLQNRVKLQLLGVAADVEVVGSSSILGLLAKPIIDLAVALDRSHSIPLVTERLQTDGWTYRGDAGSQGGHIFVLETRPSHRVAHLHVVKHCGVQWRNYLLFRDLLHRDAEARSRYEAIKLKLAEQYPTDRGSYTTGKTEVIASLLYGVS